MMIDEVCKISFELMCLSCVCKDGGDVDEKVFMEYNCDLGWLLVCDLCCCLVCVIDDLVGFGEWLVQFWVDYFIVSFGSVGNQVLIMVFVDEVICLYVNGCFEDMFFVVDIYLMMLVYLNQNSSCGLNLFFVKCCVNCVLGLNENFVCEVMELYLLGVGVFYDQNDVCQFVELLIGLIYSLQDGFVFWLNIVELGVEIVLGKSYGGGCYFSIDDICVVFCDLVWCLDIV